MSKKKATGNSNDMLYPVLTEEDLLFYSKDERTIIKGVYFFENGTYVGEFYKGKINGQGHYFFSNKNIYSGSFQDGLFHGLGQYWYSDSGVTYVGEFKLGKLHGRGILYRKDGTSIEGTWNEDRKEGVMPVRKGRDPRTWSNVLKHIEARDYNHDVLNDTQLVIEQIWDKGAKRPNKDNKIPYRLTRFECTPLPFQGK